MIFLNFIRYIIREYSLVSLLLLLLFIVSFFYYVNNHLKQFLHQLKVY